MLALDKNPPSIREFRENKKDEFLRSLARDNAQLLLNEIWKLPTERVDEVIVAKLPEPTTRLPREKPPPKPRPPTKWEEFAKLKGIQKKKKTNLMWDDVHKEWKRRWGYKRAKDDTKEWLLEVPETADPNEDQFAKRNKAKKERVAKNELNRLRNIARAQKIKVPGIGLAPTGQQSKSELEKAVHVAKLSTASVGKFQDRLPKEKAPRNTGKKRKFQPLIGDFSTEKQKQLDILKIMDGKKPRLDINKAVNKQMREEDMESDSKKKALPAVSSRAKTRAILHLWAGGALRKARSSGLLAGTQRLRSQRGGEEGLFLALGPGASLPLVRDPAHGSPSLLHRILSKPRRTCQCQGATNGAFQPD
ncbi:hypothetical protein COCON_G00068200 [Conger conger]|uniref:Ribosome biogenesis regulatory protein n=1 Tax=Conger conger TaxID=82655 RepID=A0A9Q1I3G1_CONCO|nr:hypothetical protein COCON_G00068200 [Conger conger]